MTWVNVNDYLSSDKLFTGQIGRLEGVTFVETHVPKRVITRYRLISQWDKNRHGDEIWDQLIAESNRRIYG
jgi:hypothetical protein